MKTIILIVTLLFASIGYTQVTQQWIARYNGPANTDDYADALAMDNSGNIYVTGESMGNGTDYDIATVKYNTNGIQIWAARYDGPAHSADGGFAIAVDSYGNVYIAGLSDSGGYNYGYITLKYDSSGSQQWAARYDGYDNRIVSLALDSLGNVYVTGYSWLTGSGFDFLTIKYSSAGQQIWSSRYTGTGYTGDFPAKLILDRFGNVYVTGETRLTMNDYDYLTVKYDSAGHQLWARRYNGPAGAHDYAVSIVPDNSGNVYVTGGSGNLAFSILSYATVKYESGGNQIWVARYNVSADSSDEPSAMIIDAAGNVCVTGTSGASPAGDYATIKYDSAGNQLWVSRYNGSANNDDEATAIAVDSSCNVYVTGRSIGNGTEWDYATVKYSPQGVQLWSIRYNNGSSNWYEQPSSIKVDNSGSVYVTGLGWTSFAAAYDYLTIKYNQPIGVLPISNEVAGSYRLYQNYPNPFNPVTKIKFDVSSPSPPSKGEFVNLRIFDILGREVATFVNEELKPGAYEVEWDASNFPSGVYYYKLQAGDYAETRKMVLVK